MSIAPQPQAVAMEINVVGKRQQGVCLPLHGRHVEYGSHLKNNGFDGLRVYL